MNGKAMAEIEALYHSHGEAILLYLRRNFAGVSAAEDLLQETFVHAMGSGDACAKAASPRAFLFGIARHVGLTAARRVKRGRAEKLEDIAVETTAGDEALEEMRAAIGKLPEQMRETLEFRLRYALSYEEIAEVLEVPVGTVRSRLHTAMRMLRDELNAREAR
jgi:RNA polymerase sigma-70 factor, ECF subfamily